jgi:hypothetical protein
MKYPMVILAAAVAAAAAGTPAHATGKMTCDAPQAQWKGMDALQTELKKQGWEVRKAKVDGGCYEVYGTDPDGNRVEAYFHPVSFKKLLVSRRGEILFRAK